MYNIIKKKYIIACNKISNRYKKKYISIKMGYNENFIYHKKYFYYTHNSYTFYRHYILYIIIKYYQYNTYHDIKLFLRRINTIYVNDEYQEYQEYQEQNDDKDTIIDILAQTSCSDIYIKVIMHLLHEHYVEYKRYCIKYINRYNNKKSLLHALLNNIPNYIPPLYYIKFLKKIDIKFSENNKSKILFNCIIYYNAIKIRYDFERYKNILIYVLKNYPVNNDIINKVIILNYPSLLKIILQAGIKPNAKTYNITTNKIIKKILNKYK